MSLLWQEEDAEPEYYPDPVDEAYERWRDDPTEQAAYLFLNLPIEEAVLECNLQEMPPETIDAGQKLADFVRRTTIRLGEA